MLRTLRRKNGSRYYLTNGKPHSVDGKPAIISEDGAEIAWMRHGKRHRGNGLPAHVLGDARSYYVDGKPFRECDLPTTVMRNEEDLAIYHCEWRNKNGQLHRSIGPARVILGACTYAYNGVECDGPGELAWYRRRESLNAVLRLRKSSAHEPSTSNAPRVLKALCRDDAVKSDVLACVIRYL